MTVIKKKIVHIIQSLDNGGCENMLLRTLPLLKGIDQEVIVLKKRGDLADRMETSRIKVYKAKNIFDLLRKIKEKKPALVITYLFHADFFGRFLIQPLGYKVIPYLRTTYNFPRYKAIRIFEKLTKYFVKKYLANSEAVKKYFQENIGVDPKKITVIPNGINISIFKRAKRDRKKIRQMMKVANKERVFVCVSNFHLNKGHKYLLDAFEKLFRTSPQKIWLWLVGTGEEEKNLKNQINNFKSKNRIKFLGKRNDVPSILAASDIFVLPTLFEGMSNAIMEAMASELPIVTTRIPENTSLFGRNDELVEIKSSESIYNKVNQYLTDTDLVINEVNKNKKIVEENYDIYTVAEKFNKYLLAEVK
ncbi:MAG: hypothetical protein UX41_C0011G0004 [Candidatus Collierbacteria bacterium GW2011_GWE1_46_18]|uniref:Glycosyltransferase n=1 Tax=Candidatus Collierbacteria bacterium GW2011_GWE1_46_18 TaxID=1618399 RepID=A0A0G1PAY4_9BACT|nr:MAG: hypothetical protein UX41_C0011G0004 [Candidatus Collierbacteria bacterium GW2011_GWE1_46_18]HBD95953.1 hypothetical protein [Spirochaetia bacterium]